MTFPFSEQTDPTRLLFSCPLCHETYTPLQARMLGRFGEGQLWHVMCKNCLHAIMLAVIINDQGVNSVGVLTDLKSHEALRFHSQPPVSSDDCLTLHAVLQHQPELLIN